MKKIFLALATLLSLTVNAYAVDPKADRIAIRDTSGNFTADNVEDALAELKTTGASSARQSISETITGIDYNNSTGVFSTTTGYVIPTTTEESNWNTAYGWGNHALVGYLTVETDPQFDTKFSAKTTANLTENTNLYYTDARARAAVSESVTGLDYNNSTGVLSQTTGYVIPTTTEQTNWGTAYSVVNSFNTNAGFIKGDGASGYFYVGETGTGTVALSDSPVFTTQITTPVIKSTANLSLLPTATGDLYLFSSTGANRNVYQYGYITAGASNKYISWKVDDVDDYFRLGRQDTNILGFDIDMPVLSDSFSSPIFSSNNADSADAGIFRLGNGENIAWEASPAGTDYTMGVDASEILQLSGSYALPNVTFSSGNNNITGPNTSQDTYTITGKTSDADGLKSLNIYFSTTGDAVIYPTHSNIATTAGSWLYLYGEDATSVDGGGVYIAGGQANGSSEGAWAELDGTSSDGAGGWAFVGAGDAAPGSGTSGGGFQLFAGQGDGAGYGGDAQFFGGRPGATGLAGEILFGVYTTAGGGENITLRASAADTITLNTNSGVSSIIFTPELTVGTITDGDVTSLNVLSAATTYSEINAYGTGQGGGWIYVGQDVQYGGGISYNGDNNPAMVTGETQDGVTFFRRNAGTSTKVFSYQYDSSTISFSNGETLANGTNGRLDFGGVGGTNNENMLIDFETNADAYTFSSGSGAVPYFNSAIRIAADSNAIFSGLTSRWVHQFDTAETNDSAKIGLALNNAANSGNLVIVELADIDTNFSIPLATDPTLRIQSADATTTSDWIAFFHNQTNPVIKIGNGSLNFQDANANEMAIMSYVSSAVNELTFVNAPTGANPGITATGSDTNIGITITPKGTGGVVIGGSVPADMLAGDFGYETTQKSFKQGTAGGVDSYIPGVLFTQTADKSISDGNETTMFATGVGTLTLPANFWTVGKTLRVTLVGRYTEDGADGALTLRAKLGATTIYTDSTVVLNAGATNQLTYWQYLITCRTTGATGTVMTQPTNEIWSYNASTATTTVDTTASAALDVTWDFSDTTGDSVTVTNAIIEILN